jgi:hypothetical protein
MFPVYGGKCLSRKAVHNCVKKFSQSLSKFANDARPGADVAETTVRRHSFCGWPISWLFLVCSSFRDQVSRPYGTTAKVIDFYILIFKFFHRSPEDRTFWAEWHKALTEFSRLLISSWINFDLYTVVPKYLNCAIFSKNLVTIFMLRFCPAFLWRNSKILRSIWPLLGKGLVNTSPNLRY